jgi:hypothetical protein
MGIKLPQKVCGGDHGEPSDALMTPHDIPALMGAILIIAGIIQVFLQMFRMASVASKGKATSQGTHEWRDGFKILAIYPGLVMLCIGAGLLLVVIFAGRSSN